MPDPSIKHFAHSLAGRPLNEWHGVWSGNCIRLKEREFGEAGDHLQAHRLVQGVRAKPEKERRRRGSHVCVDPRVRICRTNPHEVGW
jgi:hypothetical protein